MTALVIIVFGLPGSGKSYFASRLANKLSARYLNSDVIRQQLLATGKYSPNEKMRIYNELLREMKLAIRKNESIVLDATFYLENIRNKFMKAAKKDGQNILFIEVWSHEKIIKERLIKERKFSEADFSVYLKIKQEFEPMIDGHLLLQSTQENIEQMIATSMLYIQQVNG